MQRTIALFFLASVTSVLAAPPEQDRQAILKMAGNFNVSFDFEETFPVAPDYKPLSKPYHEEAIEVVTVAEDTPERITLQHLLVVGKDGKSRVIKHWAQVWTWEDTRILDYAGSDGSDVWERHTVPASEAKGQWSQLVTSVPTRRPLPRREYEVRDDYDYLIVINRHTLTPTGWVHSQDNRKVVDRDGKKFVLSHETGLNQYNRTEDALAIKASDWWKENATVWNSIRNFWIDAGQQPGPKFSYLTTRDGVGLSKKFNELEKAKPAPEAVIEALVPYLSASR